jgi:hypothetical protein
MVLLLQLRVLEETLVLRMIRLAAMRANLAFVIGLACRTTMKG